MRNLAVYLKKYRKESIIAPLFKLLEALFDLFVPLLVARMIDAGGTADGTRTVWLSFGGLLLMAAPLTYICVKRRERRSNRKAS